MANYKYLDHTADIKIQAWGKNLEEAFVNGAIGMFNMLLDPNKVKPKIKKELKVEAKRDESLLYDFIDELLYYLSVDGMLLSKIEDIKIEKTEKGYKVEATVFGDYFKNYEVTGDIKSATYNEMFIKQEKDKALIQFVVDI